MIQNETNHTIYTFEYEISVHFFCYRFISFVRMDTILHFNQMLLRAHHLNRAAALHPTCQCKKLHDASSRPHSISNAAGWGWAARKALQLAGKLMHITQA